MKSALIILLTIAFHLQLKAQQSFDVTFEHEGKTVYGTFTRPEGDSQFLTIIFNPGSGASDRNGTLEMIGANVACLYPELLYETITPYKDLAEDLVEAGYAVLRYDELEYTYTTPSALGEKSFRKLYLPVESAIDYVKTRSDVDTTRLVLLGHSEGSSLIPYIARSRNDVHALISVAGPRTPLDSILAYQLVEISETCGGNVNLAQAQANQILDYFDNIRTGNWNESTPDLMGAPANVWEDYTEVIDSVSINYNLSNLPTLFIGLGLDINVPPAELERFESEVSIIDDFWLIPDLIHYMTPNDIPQVAPVLSDTIVYWLGQNVITSDPSIRALNEDELKISPNPFKENLSISVNRSNGTDVQISMTDLSGKIVLQELHKSLRGSFRHVIELSQFPSGMYILHVVLDGKRFTEKMIKE